MEIFTAAFLCELAEKSGDPAVLRLLRERLAQDVDQVPFAVLQQPDNLHPQATALRRKVRTLRRMTEYITAAPDVVRFYALLARYRQEDLALQRQ